ncbi:MAG TPA: chitobiase/beta-hexosaminidase C-terminal domain-containing protein, partial [Chthoniobacteraceae bacterium]
MSPRLILFLMFLALSTGAWAGEPVISEFMASNSNGLQDEEGKYSDWIEIRNTDSVAVSLNGWYLTDDATSKRKWTFPDVTLPGNGQLVVFASGNNRRVAGQTLHTNFSLAADGEYLALVRPDGVTVTTEFAPSYPPQFSNISYGTARAVQSVILTDKGSSCRALIPSSNIGTIWRQRAFTDTSWASGTLGVGYMNSNANPNMSADIGLNVSSMYGGNNTVYIRVPFNVTDPSTISRLILRCRYDDGFAAFVNGTYGALANSPALGSLAWNSAATANHEGSTFESFDVTAAASGLVAGTNILAIHGMNSNNGSSDLLILPQLVAEVATGAAGQTGYFKTSTPGQANGGNDSVQPPQVIAFSVPGGIYTSTVTLTLSGAAAGQSIRYTTNGSEPTASSALYTGPLNVSSSTHIRARVVTSDGSLGRINSAQYTFLNANAQSFTSRLPLLVIRNVDPLLQGDITTQGEKVACYAQLIDRNATGQAALNTQPTLQHRCGLSVRGSTSSGNAKKPFSLEFRNESNEDESVPVLDMPENSDWVLLGPYSFDRTFMHDALIYEVSRQIGRWAPRTRFVEVFINTSTSGNIDYASATS